MSSVRPYGKPNAVFPVSDDASDTDNHLMKVKGQHQTMSGTDSPSPLAEAPVSWPGIGRSVSGTGGVGDRGGWGLGVAVHQADRRSCRTPINFNGSCQPALGCVAGMKHMALVGIHRDTGGGVYLGFPLFLLSFSSPLSFSSSSLYSTTPPLVS